MYLYVFIIDCLVSEIIVCWMWCYEKYLWQSVWKSIYAATCVACGWLPSKLYWLLAGIVLANKLIQFSTSFLSPNIDKRFKFHIHIPISGRKHPIYGLFGGIWWKWWCEWASPSKTKRRNSLKELRCSNWLKLNQWPFYRSFSHPCHTVRSTTKNKSY